MEYHVLLYSDYHMFERLVLEPRKTDFRWPLLSCSSCERKSDAASSLRRLRMLSDSYAAQGIRHNSAYIVIICPATKAVRQLKNALVEERQTEIRTCILLYTIPISSVKKIFNKGEGRGEEGGKGGGMNARSGLTWL